MAILYITEYASERVLNGNAVQIAAEPAVANQTVAISGSSAQSAAFSTATNIVRIHTDSICSVNFGTNPTATTSSRRMNAGDTEYFSVPTYAILKVAVILNT